MPEIYLSLQSPPPSPFVRTTLLSVQKNPVQNSGPSTDQENPRSSNDSWTISSTHHSYLPGLHLQGREDQSKQSKVSHDSVPIKRERWLAVGWWVERIPWGGAERPWLEGGGGRPSPAAHCTLSPDGHAHFNGCHCCRHQILEAIGVLTHSIVTIKYSVGAIGVLTCSILKVTKRWVLSTFSLYIGGKRGVESSASWLWYLGHDNTHQGRGVTRVQIQAVWLQSHHF